MKANRKDFESGWVDISLALSYEEIDRVIELLTELKEEKIGHFHLGSRYDDDSRVSDIEFSVIGKEEKHNMGILGGPIAPND